MDRLKRFFKERHSSHDGKLHKRTGSDTNFYPPLPAPPSFNPIKMGEYGQSSLSNHVRASSPQVDDSINPTKLKSSFEFRNKPIDDTESRYEADLTTKIGGMSLDDGSSSLRKGKSVTDSIPRKPPTLTSPTVSPDHLSRPSWTMPEPVPYSGPSMTMLRVLASVDDEKAYLPRPEQNLSPYTTYTTPPSRPRSGPPRTVPVNLRPGVQIGPPSPPARIRRAISSPVESSISAPLPTRKKVEGKLQCAAITKEGERCSRMVNIPPNNAFYFSDDDGDKQLPDVFCHQHEKIINKPSGLYMKNIWIEYDHWIPSYLQEKTKASLRAEMAKKPSVKDTDGYIYVYEIREMGNGDRVYLKVGRTTKLVKRLDEWAKQCVSKEPVLRWWWPGEVEEDEHSNIRGRIKPGNKGRFCHRLEKLIHLELGDVALNAPYLKNADGTSTSSDDNSEEGTPKRKKGKTEEGKSSASSQSSLSVSTPGTPVKGRQSKAANSYKFECPDCGKVHQEIFSFAFLKGSDRGKEWELLVKSVVERWGQFVQNYY